MSTTTKKQSLYQIQQKYISVLEHIEEVEGVLDDDLEERLSISQDELEEKALAYIEFINDKKSYIERINSEIKRLQAMKKREENVVDRLSDSLLDSVKRTYKSIAI